MRNLVLTFMLVLSSATALATPFERIVGRLQNYACTGCHMGNSASTSMANWLNTPPWETQKAFAYRHEAVAQELRRRLGASTAERYLQNYRDLETPRLKASMPYSEFEAWLVNALSRDGETTYESLQRHEPEFLQQMKDWHASGLALPAHTVRAVVCEIINGGVVDESAISSTPADLCPR